MYSMVQENCISVEFWVMWQRKFFLNWLPLFSVSISFHSRQQHPKANKILLICINQFLHQLLLTPPVVLFEYISQLYNFFSSLQFRKYKHWSSSRFITPPTWFFERTYGKCVIFAIVSLSKSLYILHPPFSGDLAASNYLLFLSLTEWLGWRKLAPSM